MNRPNFDLVTNMLITIFKQLLVFQLIIQKISKPKLPYIYFKEQ